MITFIILFILVALCVIVCKLRDRNESLDTDRRCERYNCMQEVYLLAGLVDNSDVGKPQGLGQALCQAVGLLLPRGNVYRRITFLFDLGDELAVGKAMCLLTAMGRHAHAIAMAVRFSMYIVTELSLL